MTTGLMSLSGHVSGRENSVKIGFSTSLLYIGSFVSRKQPCICICRITIILGTCLLYLLKEKKLDYAGRFCFEFLDCMEFELSNDPRNGKLIAVRLQRLQPGSVVIEV